MRRELEELQEHLVNPEKAVPFLWGMVIAMFIFSMVFADFYYRDYVQVHNDIQELKENISTLWASCILSNSSEEPLVIDAHVLPGGWYNGGT